MCGINCAAILERTKNIILKPAQEWDKIAAESATVKDLFLGYAAVLAAIPAVCGFLGLVLFGYPFLGRALNVSFMNALSFGISSYILGLIGVGITGFVIDALATAFEGEKNQTQAFKVAVYSMTPAWIVGIFSLVPSLSVLGLLGLYAVYLMYVGLPKLMKSPPTKSIAYTASVIVVGIVLSVIVSGLSSKLISPVGLPG